jgi:hypothetical protein
MYIELITHGRPSPKKTLTEFDPVTFPIAESAYSEFLAAVILAKVSGSEVPIETMVIAVMDGSNPITHPRSPATEPTIAVMRPIKVSAIPNAGPPPHIFGGGTIAKSSFQPINKKWNIASKKPT